MESRGMNLLQEKEQHRRESLVLLPHSLACFPDAVATETNAVVFEILLTSWILFVVVLSEACKKAALNFGLGSAEEAGRPPWASHQAMLSKAPTCSLSARHSCSVCWETLHLAGK